MCDTGGDGASGGIGPDGMGAASIGQANNAEPGAASIGADVGAATGSGGLGGGMGSGKGDNSGAGGGFGGSAVGGTTDTSGTPDAPGSFGGLGVGGIGALGEGMAVGTPDAPGTIGGIASGTALGGMTSFDPNAPTVDSVEGTVDMASLSPENADIAAAMAGTTDLAGANLGIGPMSQLGQVGSMISGLVSKVPGLGIVGKLGQMGINSLEGRTNAMSLSPSDLAMGAIMGLVDPLGITSGRYGPAAASDMAESAAREGSYGGTRS